MSRGAAPPERVGVAAGRRSRFRRGRVPPARTRAPTNRKGRPFRRRPAPGRRLGGRSAGEDVVGKEVGGVVEGARGSVGRRCHSAGLSTATAATRAAPRVSASSSAPYPPIDQPNKPDSRRGQAHPRASSARTRRVSIACGFFAAAGGGASRNGHHRQPPARTNGGVPPADRVGEVPVQPQLRRAALPASPPRPCRDAGRPGRRSPDARFRAVG